MELHPQFIFDMEMEAMKKFIHKMAMNNPNSIPMSSTQRLLQFFNTYMPHSLWKSQVKDMVVPAFTQKEKVTYLLYMGVSNRQIQQIMSMSPNKIVEIAKNPSFRHYPDPDIDLQFILDAWSVYREMLPPELFIKYIK